MADLGFWIAEGIILKYCLLTVTLKSQNTNWEVKKTKTAQNVRIYEKHVMSQIKKCKILSSTLSFTALHHCRDFAADVLDSAN